MEEQANKIQMANVRMSEANKEYPWAIPYGCQWFTLQTRGGAAIRVATQSGLVESSQPPFFSIKADNSWNEKQLHVEYKQGIQLFFASSTAGEVLEILMGVTDMGGE